MTLLDLFATMDQKEAMKHIYFNLFSQNKYACLAAVGNLSPLCSAPEALGRQGKAGFVAGVACGENKYILKREDVSMYVQIYRPRDYMGPNDPSLIKPVKRWFGMPEYVNEVIIGFVLNSIGFGTPQVAAFMCPENSNGYIVQERAECGDFASFLASEVCTASITADLVLDILSQLHYLETTFNFTHGDMKPQNILVFRDRTGGFLARLTDFGKSAITWNGHRIFHRLIRSSEMAVSTLARPNKVKEDGTYVVANADWIVGANARHRRFIYYLNYDMYTFMTLVALTDVGKQAISENADLKAIWARMWTNASDVEKKLKTLKASPSVNLNSITTAYKVLSGLTLQSRLIR